MATKYLVQVRGVSEWGMSGVVSRNTWVPAISGTINQTGTDSETASTFETWEDAKAAKDMVWDMLADSADEESPAGDLHLRIVEVET